MLSASDRQQLCSLSPPTRGRSNRRCVDLRHACLHAEQILLYGEDAQRDSAKLLRVADGVDLFDVKQPLLPGDHNMALAAAPGQSYDYVPLVVSAHLAKRRHRMHVSHGGIGPTNVVVRAKQPDGMPTFSNRSTGLAFITTWSNAWQETFHRAVPLVFEEFCFSEKGLTVIPAAWGSTALPGAESDAASVDIWLAPFSQNEVWPIALMPTPDRVQQQLFGNKA
ncbi:MAG: hypothetical protein SGPRY_009709, partial [Prymnesium sp.]